MADEKYIEVEGVHVHPETGYITIRVKTVTKQGQTTWNGPVRGYGMDGASFIHRFNGDMEQVKNWIKSQHMPYHGAHVDLVAALHKLKGSKI